MGNANSMQAENTTSLCNSLSELKSINEERDFLTDSETLEDKKYNEECPTTEHEDPYEYKEDLESSNIIGRHAMNINISNKNAADLKKKYDKLVDSLELNKASVTKNGRVLLIQNIVTILCIVTSFLLFVYLCYSYDFVTQHKMIFISIVIAILLCLCYYIYSFITKITSMSDVTRKSFFKIGDSSTSLASSVRRGINKSLGILD